MIFHPNFTLFPRRSSYQRNHAQNNITIQQLDQTQMDKDKETFQYNEQYFRPSKYPAINTIDSNEYLLNYNHENHTEIKLPDIFTSSASAVILYFFSLLREANQNAAMNVGCGSVGTGITPYPMAYNLLSADLQNELSYPQFLNLFETIYHINLIAMLPLNNQKPSENSDLYLIELETLEGNSFHYYYSYLSIKNENSQYRINSLDFDKEDFFCAAYHGWNHNAESAVAIMYGDWCGLIKKQYPTQQEKYTKSIVIDGTDGIQYLFVFHELTNGTDLSIGQYKKSNSGHWIPVSIDPHQCLDQEKV